MNVSISFGINIQKRFQFRSSNSKLISGSEMENPENFDSKTFNSLLSRMHIIGKGKFAENAVQESYMEQTRRKTRVDSEDKNYIDEVNQENMKPNKSEIDSDIEF